MTIEFSAPTVLRGHNRDPLAVDLLADVVDLVLDDLRARLPDVPQRDQLDLQRLDLTRDFHRVPSPTAVLAALSHRVTAYAQDQANYLRPDGGMQTIVRGTKRNYLVRGYDKEYELARLARRTRNPAHRGFLEAWVEVSKGQLRFEAQLRRSELKKRGLLTMTDCVADRLEEVAEVYFERVGWSNPYGGVRVAEQLVALAKELRPAEYRNLLTYLHAQELGVPSGLNRNVESAARATVRKYHLMDRDDGGELRRLDFKDGR
ncbi:hypothetical protein [Nocardioides sp. 616]|uniref:hypothetical protein n=1 Tax=Nocardioides sp. 616 TaxID=2268090 RepID=UPI0013B3942A|nr:hypothetical protein [Nocardioides sp. 616]